MPEILRKSILFGIGSAYLTKEKVEAFVNELVSTNNLNAEEGKKIAQEALDKLNEYRVKQEADLKTLLTNVLTDAGVATKKDISDLSGKIDKLAK